MAVTNPITTSLPAFVEQNTTPLLKSVIFGAKTIAYTAFQIAHGKTAINLIDATTEFQSAAGCGFTPKGTANHTQRDIDAKAIKLDMEFCPENYRSTYANYMIDKANGNTELPFEDYYLKAITDSAALALDKMLWQGDTTSGTGQLKLIDGLVKIALADESTVKVDVPNATSKYDAVQQVIDKIPEEAFQDDLRIFCTPAFLRGYKAEVVAKNLYHYDVDANAQEMFVPGSSVRLTAVPGLIGAKKASDYDGILFAARGKHVVYGSDTEDPNNRFVMDYDKKQDTMYLKVKMVAGINYGISSEVVIAKLKTA